MSEEKDIVPILDLESFVFTPPGPMGWAFEMTEEDELNVKQGIQSMIEAENVLSLHSLVELSSNRQQENIVESKEIKSAAENDDEKKVQQNIGDIDEVVTMEEIILGDKSNEDEAVTEESEEQVVMKNKVKIILPNTPAKAPWLSNSQLGRFRK